MSEKSTAAGLGGLTGRIGRPPNAVLHDEVLEPQFRHEAEHLLPYYVQAEQALLAEYLRMGLLDADQTGQIAKALNELGEASGHGPAADPKGNLSDMALAVERQVTARLPAPVPAWHVDRSRNDLQASAQLMFGRAQTLQVIADLLACATPARRVAARYARDVMPGYTHLQAAQVVTPGFFLSALSAHLLRTVGRLLAAYDDFNLCPLGSGALAGQELAWDRERLADLLAFRGPEPHALVAVVSRAWVLELAAECSTFAVGLSRLVTDLMTWAGSEHGFVELPDELAGISSAMPQKKNYPVLERIRGRTAHLTAWYVDVATAQRNTPYSNTVEVSKEGTAQLPGAVRALRSALRLLTEVLDGLVFRVDHTRARCAEEYLGGFSLANRLTLEHNVPWRDAQVIAGHYIVAALSEGRSADATDESLLAKVAGDHGHAVAEADAGRMLGDAFDPDAELARRHSTGSAHPEQVLRLLDAQDEEHEGLAARLAARQEAVGGVPARIDEALGPAAAGWTAPGGR